MKQIKIIISVLTIVVMQACTTMKSDSSEMTGIINIMMKDDPTKYQSVMMSFVKSAKEGDIDKMLSLTSEITIKQSGLKNLRQIYKVDSSPALKMCQSMSEGGKSYYLDDEEVGTGWIFIKNCVMSNDKSVPLRFTVLKEKGDIVIASWGLANPNSIK